MKSPAIFDHGKLGRWEEAWAFLEGNLIKQGGWILWNLALTAVFLVCNFPLILGRAVGKWDVDGAYMAYYVLIADLARAGRFLYWDPWSNAGMPMMGDPQVGAFSPVVLLFGLLTGGETRGFIVYWLCMWWLGGLGMMILARYLKAPAWGGFVVSMGFLFCGAYTGHAQHTSIVIGISFLPLIIWRLDVALTSNRLKPALEAGALWGLSALSAYPGITIISGCFSGMWALGRYLTVSPSGVDRSFGGAEPIIGKTTRPQFSFILAALFMMCTVGALVLLPTYFSFMHEGAGHHSRVGALSRETAIGENALDPGAIATISSNYLSCLQMKNLNVLWPRTDVSLSSIYTGSLIVALALLGLVSDFKNRWRWWLVGLGGLGLACAMGRTFPLRGWLYDWVYPMRFFRHAGIFRAYYLFIMAVLALLTTRDLAIGIQRKDGGCWAFFFKVCLFLSICMISVYFVTYCSIPNGYGVEDLLAAVHLVLAWGGLLLVAFFGRVWGTDSRRERIALMMVVLAVADAFLCAVLAKNTIFNFHARERWKDLDQAHSSEIDLTNNGLWRSKMSFNRHSDAKELRNDQMITKVPVFMAYGQETNIYHMLMATEPALRRPAVGEDRIWFSPEALQVPVSRASFDIWAATAIQKGSPTLVLHSPEEMLGIRPATPDEFRSLMCISSLPPLQRLQVRLIKYLPEELSFEVTCPMAGWLLVTDRWARSWSAEVNSKEETVYGGNFVFRAVRVAEGLNRVRFAYSPLGFPWLILVSWCTLTVVLLLALSSIYERPKRDVVPDPTCGGVVRGD